MLKSLSSWYWELVGNSPDVVAAASVVLALLVSVIMLAMVKLRKPEWFNETTEELPNIENVRAKWNKFAIVAFILSIALPVVSVALAWFSQLLFFAPFISVGLAVVTFLAYFSTLTDPNVRLVDRHILRVGMLITLLSTLVCTLFTHQGQLSQLTGFLVIFGVMVFVCILPIMGASDSRAIMIVFLSLTSVLFTAGLVTSWVSTIVIAFCYALYKSKWNFKNALTKKVSLPLVPMLLWPTVPLLTFAAPLITSGLVL